MQPLRFMHLDLRAPIDGRDLQNAEDFFGTPLQGERFARFSLSADKLEDIDAQPTDFLGAPDFVAIVSPDGVDRCIPAGEYWFSQIKIEGHSIERSLADEMALEVHKEGLWSRLHLGPHVFVRLLQEGTEIVIQILRELLT
jgi:hypothetical protein